jgi:quinolinate synthase
VLISEDDILAAKARYPEAAVMVHPECTTPVRDLADRVLSTGQMLKWVKERPARRFIVGTETGILHALRKENPDADYVPANDRAVCPNMKKITLEKLLWALEDMTCRVTVAEDVAGRARAALDRMLEGT